MLNLWNGHSGFVFVSRVVPNKETTFERADFTLQLLMFVTIEKEREMYIIFYLSIFCKLLSLQF